MKADKQHSTLDVIKRIRAIATPTDRQPKTAAA
jgi:hypothetical protein